MIMKTVEKMITADYYYCFFVVVFGSLVVVCAVLAVFYSSSSGPSGLFVCFLSMKSKYLGVLWSQVCVKV